MKIKIHVFPHYSPGQVHIRIGMVTHNLASAFGASSLKQRVVGRFGFGPFLQEGGEIVGEHARGLVLGRNDPRSPRYART